MSELAQDTVHHPIDGRRAYRSTRAGPEALQIFYHGLDDGQLHVRRIGHDKVGCAFARNKSDGLIIEDRERKRAFVADDVYAIFLRTLMSHETPRCTSRKSVRE